MAMKMVFMSVRFPPARCAGSLLPVTRKKNHSSSEAGRAHKHTMFHLLLSAVEALQKYSKEMIACKIDSD